MARTSRESWGSRLGFIFAASGAAIGLGNIQRFPYITAQCGGGAFLLLYLVCVILLGLPLMLVEFSIGRHTQRNPAWAFATIRSNWLSKCLGFFCVFTAFAILCYYLIPAGWAIGFSILALFPKSSMTLADFTANPTYSLGSAALI